MYLIIRFYDDLTSNNEIARYITLVFSAIAVYLEDPHCIGVKVVNLSSGETIVNYWAK